MKTTLNKIFFLSSFILTSIWISTFISGANLFFLNKSLYNYFIFSQTRHYLYISFIIISLIILQYKFFKKTKSSKTFNKKLIIFYLLVWGVSAFLFLSQVIYLLPFRISYEGCGKKFNSIYPDKEIICQTLNPEDYYSKWNMSGGKSCRTFDRKVINFLDRGAPTFCKDYQ